MDFLTYKHILLRFSNARALGQLWNTYDIMIDDHDHMESIAINLGHNNAVYVYLHIPCGMCVWVCVSVFPYGIPSNYRRAAYDSLVSQEAFRIRPVSHRRNCEIPKRINSWAKLNGEQATIHYYEHAKRTDMRPLRRDCIQKVGGQMQINQHINPEWTRVLWEFLWFVEDSVWRSRISKD